MNFESLPKPTFSNTIENRYVLLQNAVEVVTFSFIAKKSILYLDLALCTRKFNRRICESCRCGFSCSFFNTEERCRKVFAPSRKLLYTLHLDLPLGREYSLKDGFKGHDLKPYPSIPHLGAIVLPLQFEFPMLCDFVEAALQVVDRRKKILECLLKIPFLKKNFVFYLPGRIADIFIDCMYPYETLSATFREFIRNFDLAKWMYQNERPEAVDCVLFHLLRYGRARSDSYSISSVANWCIVTGRLRNISSVLKYTDWFEISEDNHGLYFCRVLGLRPTLTSNVLLTVERRNSNQRRTFLMLQILYLYILSSYSRLSQDATDVLGLIWRSVPDTCITLREFTSAFVDVLEAGEINDMYKFYCKSAEDHSCVEPRSLKHLCRTTVRRAFSKNNVWIPYGVTQIRLPKILQQYVNLES